MTMLLASVTGSDEAEIALAHGADIIDLKDPAKGALGALPCAMVRDIVTAVAGRRPVSAVTGDLPMEPELVMSAARHMAETGVDYIKVGLFPGPRRADCVRALATLARQSKLVAVMFADREPDLALLALIAECGFAGCMLDTAGKRQGRLLDHVDMSFLQAFIEQCRLHDLMTGLAGSLEAPDIPRLLLLAPDFLGFRGALCAQHDRTAGIDPDAVRVVRDLIPTDRLDSTGESEAEATPYHPLFPREHGDGAGRGALTDRIFVRDFVLPVRVGAYAHERDNPQRVRFDVEAVATRSARAALELRDVISYDLIMDAIRIIVAREHIPLVETLAERIAGFLLAHPRVASVKVRVEKLDVGPGGVGVEIVRERQHDVAKVFHLYPAAAGKSA
jgi:dihydroneopterin aldolase